MSEHPLIDHAVVTTGHMIDQPGRIKPRFPNVPQLVALAAAEIAAQLDSMDATAPVGLGVAAAASGADIVFHEVCHRRQILTEVHLALRPEEFVDKSVRAAGPEWIDRFNAVVATSPVFLVETDPDSEQSIWQQANVAMLQRACAVAERVSLIALWDETTIGLPGGTADMVDAASARNVELAIIDLATLRRQAGLE